MASLNYILYKTIRTKVAKGPSYGAYLKKKKKSQEKPLSEDQWKVKVLGQKPKTKKKGPSSSLLKERVKEVKDGLPLDLQKYPSNVKPKQLLPKHREEIKDYNLEVVGTDAAQAVEIARKIKEGISQSADVCKMSPPVCIGNKGLSRDKMPQIEGGKSVKEMLASKDPLDRKKGKAMVQAGADPSDDRNILQQMIDRLSKNGVRTTKTKVPVGKLKATQKEIKASKTFSMADSHLKGKFGEIGDSIVVSKDGHILDGHHRWAALLTIDPKRTMSVKVIDMDMDDLLKEAASTPGVYKANFKGNPLKKKEQLAYKKKNQSRFDKTARSIWQVARSYPKLAKELQSASWEDLSFPEREDLFPERASSFHMDLWRNLNIKMKKLLGKSKSTMTKRRGLNIWKWITPEVTFEAEVDDNGNVEISFLTHIGGPGFLKRILAPRISDVLKQTDRGYSSMKL